VENYVIGDQVDLISLDIIAIAFRYINIQYNTHSICLLAKLGNA